MNLNVNVAQVEESMTLKLNAKAVALVKEGRHVLNLTAGQLPFHPPAQLVGQIKSELNFLKSFQYSPAGGYFELREKFTNYIEKRVEIDLDKKKFGCVISNGAKHTLYNILKTILNPAEEVVIIAPYWVSYPEIIKVCDGVPVVVESNRLKNFIPAIEDIKAAISDKTKAIIINSPNNPTGIHYPQEWMSKFAQLVKKHKELYVISDEIYFDLCYYDPAPTYFYQKEPSLLTRTIIVDGISKAFACSGLRIGYCIAPKYISDAMIRLQGHTASGANSLMQAALINYDFDQNAGFLGGVKDHLRSNASMLNKKFQKAKLDKIWYQPLSAFYYFIDFSRTPVCDRLKSQLGKKSDYSMAISEDLLENHGVAVVPGGVFGAPNCVRISLVLETPQFEEAIDKIIQYIFPS
ncbi:MAG: aminotransferase class I/II-fold pyridoxal phosphate-dependent enzyme [Bacteriovoracaceae bacterium]|nr:aminotransferase class I/II-fold pyridoxal phosphate-dependent enzyme [Bacteriovoracaceae bacterium]